MVSVWTFQLGHPIEQWSEGSWIKGHGDHIKRSRLQVGMWELLAHLWEW